MPSSEPEPAREERDLLSGIAWRSVERAAHRKPPLRIDASTYPERVREPGASFVTLRLAGALRGCIGSLEPTRSLVDDVAHNARAAALDDPRFPPLEPEELARLELHLSVLGPLERIPVGTREELLAQLRPGMDGLVLRHDSRRATFLPGVWESLPEPEAFVSELERKAGFDTRAWKKGVDAFRYTVWDWQA
ncbi:MAG: AmmeMemoRadiSam system protein A [Myxococcota bacterium]